MKHLLGLAPSFGSWKGRGCGYQLCRHRGRERKTERGEKVRGRVRGSDREIRTVGWWGSERSAVTVVRQDRGRKTDYGN